MRCSDKMIGEDLGTLHISVVSVGLLHWCNRALCRQVSVSRAWNSLWFHWSQNFTSESEYLADYSLVWLQWGFGCIKSCSVWVNTSHSWECRSAGGSLLGGRRGSKGNYPKELSYWIFVFSPWMWSMSKYINVNAMFPWRKGLWFAFLYFESKILIDNTCLLFTTIRFWLNDALRHIIVCIVKSPVVPLQTVCCAEFRKYMSA